MATTYPREVSLRELPVTPSRSFSRMPHASRAVKLRTSMRSEIGKMTLDRTFEERDAMNQADSDRGSGWGRRGKNLDTRIPPRDMSNGPKTGDLFTSVWLFGIGSLDFDNFVG